MTRTDGEHELVLGNKQLLSAFFVVVVLLGVFFTMGYFVGRNTAGASGFGSGQNPASSGNQRPDAAGKPLDSGSSTPSTPPPDSTTPAADPTPPPAEQPAPQAEAKTAPPPAEKPKETPPEAPKSDAMATPSPEQMYLQVFALRRPDADSQVKVLRKHGFTALLGESSKEGIYRVLVGPFKTNGEMGRTKSALKAKGFDSIVAK